MKTLIKFSAAYQGRNISVSFGIPVEPEEMEEMYKLRYQVYRDRNYIDSSKYANLAEKDTYDQENKCLYFIAKYEDKIVGTIRLIKDNILPTELDFSFSEPGGIKAIDRPHRAELGRYISIPLNRDKKIYMPRGMSMLIMFHMLADFALSNNIEGGYSFIKSKLEKKMSKRHFPFHKIDGYKLNIDKDNTLYNYFSNKEDLVIPIYYFSKEVFDYTNKLLDNRFVFKRGGNAIILKNNIYTKLLAFFRVI